MKISNNWSALSDLLNKINHNYPNWYTCTKYGVSLFSKIIVQLTVQLYTTNINPTSYENCIYKVLIWMHHFLLSYFNRITMIALNTLHSLVIFTILNKNESLPKWQRWNHCEICLLVWCNYFEQFQLLYIPKIIMREYNVLM